MVESLKPKLKNKNIDYYVLMVNFHENLLLRY